MGGFSETINQAVNLLGGLGEILRDQRSIVQNQVDLLDAFLQFLKDEKKLHPNNRERNSQKENHDRQKKLSRIHAGSSSHTRPGLWVLPFAY